MPNSYCANCIILASHFLIDTIYIYSNSAVLIKWKKRIFHMHILIMTMGLSVVTTEWPTNKVAIVTENAIPAKILIYLILSETLFVLTEFYVAT